MRYIKVMLLVVSVCCAGLFGAAKISKFSDRDAAAPEIVSDREVVEIPCEFTKEQLMEGVTATDDEDGDLSDKILTGNFSRFVEKGVCNLDYVVFDSSYQSAVLTRKVKFTDYHSPRYSLTAPLVFNEGEGDYEKLMERIGVTDMLDGDLKGWMFQTKSDVSYQKEGNYSVTLQVSNRFGDEAVVELPVHIVKQEYMSVQIDLVSPLVYVKKGDAVNPGQWIQGLKDRQGDPLDQSILTYYGTIDTQVPGCYEIYYWADDGIGNTGRAWITVVVEE